jgi:hypothetical protein
MSVGFFEAAGVTAVRCEEVGIAVPAFRMSGVRRTAPHGSGHRGSVARVVAQALSLPRRREP